MTLLLFWASISILFSFLCSIWEAVLLSITPSFIERNVQAGTNLGKNLKKYKEDIDRPLSAILTLNTVAHTVGSIMVGATAGDIWGKNYLNVFGLELSYEALVAGIMTLLILYLSEIIPKTIGANFWESLSGFTVKSLNIVMWILAPFIWVSQIITKSLKKDKSKSVFSRADLSAMTQVASKSGELQKSESTIIDNLLKLNDLTVRDIMTPRTVMVTLDAKKSLMDFYKEKKNMRFSRFPIFDNDADNIIGLVLKDEILMHLVEDEDNKKVEELKRPIVTVRDDMTLQKFFETLTQKRGHLAIVVDNYGSLAGLVTMEDLFETLLGFEIVDEADAVADLQRVAREKWERRAKTMGLIE